MAIIPILSCDDSLLDKVDKLRELGMQDFFPLPQIAVVGDQSSGKSTLLEYISGVTFPKDSNICTCFVTEVTMRPHPVFSAQILLNGKTDDRLDVPNSPEEVERVIQQATKLLVGEDTTRQIYQDILTVKLRGPALSSLTLVDLPGYVQTHSNGQHEDTPKRIENLCEKYLKSPSTIILAVVPANKDFETNIVIQHIRTFDGQGDRTLCVLTKPDQVDRGTEGGVIDILSGSKMALSRGYHIIKNRNYEDCQMGLSREAAVRKEAAFFESEPWSRVNPLHRGVHLLVEKLTELLTIQVQNEFPGIRKKIKERKESDEALLKSLGAPIETDFDKIRFVQSTITQITRQFKYLVDGYYSAVEVGSSYYIRAHVQLFNKAFRQKIKDMTDRKVENISVAGTMRRSKGRELPGMIQFDVLVVLFRQIVQGWKEPSEQHVNHVCDMVERVSGEVVRRECPEIILDYVLEGMGEYLEERRKRILEDVEEIRNDETTPFTCQPIYEPPQPSEHEIMPQVVSVCFSGNGSQAAVKEVEREKDSSPEHTEMRNTLREYSKVAVDRYVDAVCLYGMERNLFKRCEDRITEFFNSNKTDLTRIRESNHTRSLRKILPENIRKFEEALKEF